MQGKIIGTMLLVTAGVCTLTVAAMPVQQGIRRQREEDVRAADATDGPIAIGPGRINCTNGGALGIPTVYQPLFLPACKSRKVIFTLSAAAAGACARRGPLGSRGYGVDTSTPRVVREVGSAPLTFRSPLSASPAI